MVLARTIKEQQTELHKELWKIVNDLRGSMQSNEFRDYIFGLMMFRFLSEQLEEEARELLENDGVTFEEAVNNEELKEGIRSYIIETLGYYLSPNHLFSHMIEKIKIGEFTVVDLYDAINEFNDSIKDNENSLSAFEHIFDGMDLTSTKLGKSDKDKNNLLSELASRIAQMNFKYENIDTFGEAYEYLISKFSSDAGKSGGEFYTPASVSTILSRIVIGDRKEIASAYDATCGSGSLLLKIIGNDKKVKVGKIYGQEKTSITHNLARMNMLLHGLKYEDFDIKNGDTLENPYHIDEKFDVIVANPPYSAPWNPTDKLEDERFKDYGKLAPKSKADFAFIQHMLYQLKENGTMAIVLPHGVLFRGQAEETIRKYIIETQNSLDAVIGLPSNIFNGTSIPTCILVFKKCRKDNDNILFIDASECYEKGKNQNILGQAHIDKIVEAYEERKNIDKFAYVASLDEIRENNYNLNIPRYLDTFEEEEQVDLNEVSNEITGIEKDILNVDEKLNEFLKELGLWGGDNE